MNLTKQPRKCQAKNPATCPRHGIPIHKQYIGNMKDVAAFLEFREEANRKRKIQDGQQIPLKDMNANELEEELRNNTQKEDLEELNSSIELAAILHANQTRGNRGGFDNTPYIEHPLRNAVRLQRLGIKDNEVIIAAVLHDTIEDGAQDFLQKVQGTEIQPELEARETLSHYISKHYGGRVLSIVKAVTNDYLTDTDRRTMTLEQRNRNYLRHVKQSIENNPDVLLVKISDFIDNATGLHHNNTPVRKERTLKQATKYLPVVEVFTNELNTTRLPISEAGQKKLKQNMEITKIRLQQILNNA